MRSTFIEKKYGGTMGTMLREENKMVNPFDTVNKDFFDTAEMIEQKTGDLETAREAYLYSKARWENEYARFLLESKTKNPDAVQEEIKALATNLSYQERLNCIRAESAYRRLQNEVKALREKLDVCREISWNLRAEAKIGS